MSGIPSRYRNSQGNRFVALVGLVALFGLLPHVVNAQDVQPLPLAPPPRKLPVESQPTDIITVGTSPAKATLLLGNFTLSSEIPCLCRSMLSFQDGTKIIFVSGKAISAIPGGLAEGDPAAGYVVENQGRKVFIDACLLCGVPGPPPLYELKREVEQNYRFAPNMYHPAPPQHRLPPAPPSSFVPLRRIKLF